MVKKLLITLILISVLLFSQSFVFSAMDSDNYQIWADVISVGGGEDLSSDNYTLQDTLGQAVVGISSSTNYTSRAGYRYPEYFDGEPSITLSLGGGSVALGTLDTSAAKTGSHSLVVGTNSGTGLSVTYSGSTLTCSACTTSNTIAGIGGSAVASTPGTSQFGLNVIFSSGTSPFATSTASYTNGGNYAFFSGAEIITSIGDINDTTFTVNYVANIAGSESAGDYDTTITFTALANF